MRLLLLHNALMLIYLGSLFLNYPAPADIYTLSLHVALPIWRHWRSGGHVLREIERQISQADQSAVAREYGAPDSVFQFGSISRPGILPEQIEDFLRKAGDLAFGYRSIKIHQILRYERNVVQPLSQGWRSNRSHVQTIVQVRTKFLSTRHFLKIPVCGHDQAKIHGNRAAAANAVHFSRFHHAEELRLNFQGQFADFIEKQRACVRLFKWSLSELGSGKCAFFAPEQFRFRQAFRQAGTIQLHESGVSTLALQVDFVRD